MNNRPSTRFLFVSSNTTPWGGSEELWSAAAAELARKGRRVSVLKANVNRDEPRIRRLIELHCRISDLDQLRIFSRFPRLRRAASMFITAQRLAQLTLEMKLFNPGLVVVSQGMNFDGLHYANACRRMKKPYVLIAQKAGDVYWPDDSVRARMRKVYSAAEACYFVSEHNRRLTEEQLGFELPHARVVRNPFLVPWERRSDWPSAEEGLRLACVGRLFPAEKGQDLLLRVLAREKWRSRPLSVTLYGSGHHRVGLEKMTSYFGLTSVRFAGFVDDVPSIWNDHHGLILASRCEGLPLVLVEAMLSGRVAVTTNAGGSGEILEDGLTGFLAAAATEDAVDEALERAWQRRGEWRAIGAAAADAVRELVPPDPAEVFAGVLRAVVQEIEN
ncbi:MAG TPA: glycosyltransferase [Thermoanaerobaculia bacterium]|nr:glycosyltransferase [Thermoanaerobaculia bacterium]